MQVNTTRDRDFFCKDAFFPSSFPGSGDVKVFASLSQGNPAVSIHDPAVLWVTSVTTSGFTVCLRAAGLGKKNGTVNINWLAFQDNSGASLRDGSLSFDEWAAGTSCKTVTLSKVGYNQPSQSFYLLVVCLQNLESFQKFLENIDYFYF